MYFNLKALKLHVVLIYSKVLYGKRTLEQFKNQLVECESDIQSQVTSSVNALSEELNTAQQNIINIEETKRKASDFEVLVEFMK